MTPDWPAFGQALWQVSDQLGIRPEWQLPVLSLETGGTFNSATTNSIGCVGINQFCPSTYSNYVHVPVEQYRAWPPSAQLVGPVLDYWRNALQYGPIRSATRLMVAQLGQAKLSSVPELDNVIFQAPSLEYEQNSRLDPNKKQYITEQDLANAMWAQANSPAVSNALARTYALRPNERPLDAVYGEDYPAIRPPIKVRSRGILMAITIGGVIVGAAYGAYRLFALREPERLPEPEPEFEP